jgi:hypothetical protein
MRRLTGITEHTYLSPTKSRDRVYGPPGGDVDERAAARAVIDMKGAATHADDLVSASEEAQEAVVNQDIPGVRRVAKEIQGLAGKLLKSVGGAGGAAAEKPSGDPEWMKLAVKVADLYDDMLDELGLTSKPTGANEEKARVLFMGQVEKLVGPPRKQIPIEVYYEFEDANYHTANEMLEKAGYFDAPYGERNDAWQAAREGIKPMSDR